MAPIHRSYSRRRRLRAKLPPWNCKLPFAWIPTAANWRRYSRRRSAPYNRIVPPYDALLIVSFGGPEKYDDVIPFLENVLRGRNVPRERMLEVAEHYYHFDGRSPINDQNRALVTALQKRLHAPVYWGNRNWHPMLADTLRQMRDDGIGRRWRS